MDELLDVTVSPADLKELESNYCKELQSGKVSPDSQFQYALCLIKSPYSADIQRGVYFFEDLFEKFKNEEKRREYLYFLAIGYARLKNYTKSLQILRAFQEIEPNNPQVEPLITEVTERLNADGRRGALAVGGGILALGVALAASYILSKR